MGLDTKLFNLNKLSEKERGELQAHFTLYAKDCGLCNMCELRREIVEVYSLKFRNRRHHNSYDKAMEFVTEHYIGDSK